MEKLQKSMTARKNFFQEKQFNFVKKSKNDFLNIYIDQKKKNSKKELLKVKKFY